MSTRQSNERNISIAVMLIAAVAVTGAWYAWYRSGASILHEELTAEELEKKLTAPPTDAGSISPDAIREAVRQTSIPQNKP